MARHLFGFMYETAFINIVVYHDTIEVYIEMIYKSRVKHSMEHKFVRNDSYKDELLQKYIKPFTQETPYYYISMLDTTEEQGVVPTCDKKEIPLFKDLSALKHLCIDNRWLCYTSTTLLEREMRRTGEFGVDFVFSPFIVLKEFFKDKLDGKIALYLLIQDRSITFAVFQESHLLYGDYIDTEQEMGEMEQLTLEQPDGEEGGLEAIEDEINLDDIELGGDLGLDESFDDIDSLGNIEELDGLESLEGDDTLEEQLEEQLEENLESMDESSKGRNENEFEVAKHSSEEFKYFSLIQRSLATFYNDVRYKSDFIEHMYVADAIHLSNDFKRLVKDELFLSLYVRSVEPLMEVCNLAKKEVFKS